MERKDVQPWQANKLCQSVAPMVGYLHRLKRRMERVGFPPDDPLFLHVSKAYDAMFNLRIELHYLSCKSGVYRF